MPSAVRRPSLSQGARGGPYSCNFFRTGCRQVGTSHCEPLQLVALKTKVCCLHSLFLSQRRACASSKPLVTSCATPLACHLLLCCKSWILHFVAALFCHKPWAFQGIAFYLACVWHSSKVRALLSPWLQCGSSTDFIDTKLAL